MRLHASFVCVAALFAACAAEDPVHGLVPHADGGGPRDLGPPVDANLPPDRTCASVRLSTSLATPNVILLVDRSGSMGDIFDEGLSRWDVLQNAIIGTPGGLVPRLQATVRFGLVLFDGAATCPELVTVLPPALEDYGMIDAAYRSVGPSGSTPTGGALTSLVTQLSRMSEPPGPTIIILATDGEPNDCTGSGSTSAGQMLAISAARNAHAAGYTFDAIGVATDVALANLQAVASAGGGTAVSVTDTGSLAMALDDIVHGVTSCTLSLSGMIDTTHACDGVVELNGMPLTCGDPNGWHAVDMGHIALDGTSCDALQHPPAAVTATFPCTVIFDPTH